MASLFQRFGNSVAYRAAMIIADRQMQRVTEANATNQTYKYTDLTAIANQAKALTESPWVYVAAGKVATTAAQSAINVYTLEGEDKEEAVNHPIEQLFRKPNPTQSEYEFKHALYAWYKLSGNVYIYMVSEGGKPTELYLLRPDRIQILPGTDGRNLVKAYVYTINGTEIPIDPDNIIHWKSFNPTSDYFGLSEVQVSAISVLTDKGMADWNKNFFSKDKAIPAGVVNVGAMITDPDYERIKADWQKNYGGTSRAVAFIRGDDVKFSPMMNTHVDMEFSAGREWERKLIFDVMGLPPGLLDANSTEANALAAMETFQRDTVYPLTLAFCQKLTSHLAPYFGDNLVIEPEDRRIKDAAAERAEMQAAAPFLTINEVRQKYFQLEAVPWGDTPAVGAAAAGAIGGLPNMDKPATPQEQQAEEKDKAEANEALPDREDVQEDLAEQAKKSIPRVYFSRPIRRELEQFARYVHKHEDEGYEAFRFLHAPLPVAIAAKAYADTVDAHDLESIYKPSVKAEGRISITGKEDPHGKAKDAAEAAVNKAVSTFFDKVLALVIRNIRTAAAHAAKASNIPGSLADYMAFFDDQFWEAVLNMSEASLRGIMQDAVTMGAEDAARLLEARLGIGFDPAKFNVQAAKYANKYTDQVLQKFNTTTRDGIGAILSRWIGAEGATIGDLISAFQESALFSGKRAELVATTEVTRAFAQGEMIAGQEVAKLADVDFRAKGTGAEPPLHPNCRCWIDTVPVYDDSDRLVAFDAVFNTSRDTFVCPICEPLNGKYLSEVDA